MFQEIKRLTKHSIVYGVGNFVERLLSFLLLPLYTFLLSPFDLGINFIIYSTIAFLNIVYAYGLDTAFLRFYILAKNPEEKSSFFSTAILSIIITSLLFSGVIFIFANEISILITGEQASTSLIKMGVMILFFDAFSVFGLLVLRAEEKAKQFAALKIFKACLILVLNIVFVWGLRLGVFGIFFANVIGSAASFLSVIPVYYRVLRFVFNVEYYKELIKFGLPYIFTYVAFIIMDFIDRFFLENYCGMETVGIYGVSYQISRVMRLLVAAFGFAWHPFFLSIKEQENCKEIYARVLTYFSLVCFGLFLFTCFFVDDILKIIPFLGVEYASDYKNGLIILPYVLIAYYLFGVYVNLNVGIYIEKKSYYLPFIVGISAVINIIGNYLLIPKYNITGAAISTAFSYFVMVLLLYLVTLKIYPITYEWKRLAKCIFFTALAFWIPSFVSNDNKFIIELAALFSIPVLLWLFRFFEESEITKIRSLSKKLLRL